MQRAQRLCVGTTLKLRPIPPILSSISLATPGSLLTATPDSITLATLGSLLTATPDSITLATPDRLSMTANSSIQSSSRRGFRLQA
eukprot:1157624-Pelagomonas_calceolata.AAC.2